MVRERVKEGDSERRRRRGGWRETERSGRERLAAAH